MKVSIYARGERVTVGRAKTGRLRSFTAKLWHAAIGDPERCLNCKARIDARQGLCEDCTLERQV